MRRPHLWFMGVFVVRSPLLVVSKQNGLKRVENFDTSVRCVSSGFLAVCSLALFLEFLSAPVSHQEASDSKN